MNRRNIILITIDSLRKDFLGCYGYGGKSVSPTIDGLASEGMLFENVYSNGPNTPHAFKSIMMGKHPLDDPGFGVFDKDKYLPYLYKKDGYFTIGIVANNPALARFYGFGTGFDVFEDFMNDIQDESGEKAEVNRILEGLKEKYKRLVFKFGDRIYINMINNLLTRKFYGFLRKNSGLYRPKYSSYNDVVNRLEVILDSKADEIRHKNYFLWIHLMDVHYPYSKAENMTDAECLAINSLIDFYQLPEHAMKRSLSDSTITKIKRMYEQCILNADNGIKEVLSLLQRYNLSDDTTIFITADHGDYLGEHALLGHQRMLFEELLRVPLIIYEDNRSQNQSTFTPTVSQIDLYDLLVRIKQEELTDILPADGKKDDNKVISAMYIDDSGRLCLHQDYVSSRNMAGWANRIYSIRAGNEKLIYDGLKDEYLIYDLSEDPHEAHPKKPDDGHYMIKILKRHIRREDEARKISENKYRLDVAINQLAEALSYDNS